MAREVATENGPWEGAKEGADKRLRNKEDSHDAESKLTTLHADIIVQL